MPLEDIESLAALIEKGLISAHGPLISNDALRSALGYCSKEAFRQALSRGTVPIPVFSLEKRRGKFALARDVAHWLARQRISATPEQ